MHLLAAGTVILLYSLLCLWSWRRYHRAQPQADAATLGDADWLILYASQSGTAQSVAHKTREQLAQVGEKAQLLTLNQLSAARLQGCSRALFVVSTYGEGEAPDNGNRFLRRIQDHDLANLEFGLLALGDSSYRHFCGFGHQLHQALSHAGARSLFDLIEVDRNDASGLRHWQYYLGEVSGHPLFFDWSQPDYQSWRLHERDCLNVGSPGAPAFLLQLQPVDASISEKSWQAGDIAEIGPENDADRIARFLQQLKLDGSTTVQLDGTQCTLAAAAKIKNLPQQNDELAALRGLSAQDLLHNLADLPHREYSIASTPAQGSLDLLVRQHQDHQGFGLGSGWLTHYAPDGGAIRLRIRSNPQFHSPAAERPLILIGNGTGIAGLRAHLLARVAQGGSRNWLLFGERCAAHDFFFGEEIRRWQQEGSLARLDLAFSRDENSRARYVQDLLPPAADELRAWVDAGAAIYVCGSLKGMAKGVDDALSAIFGSEQLEALAEAQRYCRDVY